MNRRTWAVLLVGLAFVAAMLARVPYVNGPWYWQWPWRSIGLLRGALFLGVPLLLLAPLVRGLEGELDARRVRRALALVAAAMFLMTLLGILADPEPGLLRRIVQSPSATSYYSDALDIGKPLPWLANFHRAELELHSSTHPPGPILFYYLWISLFGPDAGALLGAGMIAALAALGVPILFHFAALWTDDARARLLACVLYALLPGLVLFFPCFDAVYPIFSMLLFLLWARSLEGSRPAPLLFGAALFASTLFAYNLLATGAPLLLYTMAVLSRSPAPWRRVATCAATGLATFAVLHTLLWLATGYRPVHSFLHALATQDGLAAGMRRPYLACLGFDLYDFALGGGFLPAVLVGLFLLRRADEVPEAERQARLLTTLGLLGILIVDLTGVLRCETARVWLFLQPWVLVPAALELRKWAAAPREAVLLLQWGIVVVVRCTMGFVYA